LKSGREGFIGVSDTMKRIRESIDCLVLGTLQSGPKHGYELMQLLQRRFELTWHIGTSQLYTVLRRLEDRSWVLSKVEEQATRPARRVFELTPAGRQYFLDWLREPVRHVRDLRNDFFVKVFFCGYLTEVQLTELITAQVQELVRIGQRFKQKSAKEQDPFKTLVLSSKIRSIEAWVRWLEDGQVHAMLGQIASCQKERTFVD